MSARFGRNKRRRARLELEAVTRERDMAQAEASILQKAVAYRDEEIETAKQIAGAYSVCFHPEVLDLGDMEPSPFVDISLPDDGSEGGLWNEAGSNTRYCLPTLMLDFRRVHRHDPRHSGVHALIRFAGGSVGYAIREQDLMRLPKQVLIDRMAYVLSRQFAARIDAIRKEMSSR